MKTFVFCFFRRLIKTRQTFQFFFVSGRSSSASSGFSFSYFSSFPLCPFFVVFKALCFWRKSEENTAPLHRHMSPENKKNTEFFYLSDRWQIRMPCSTFSSHCVVTQHSIKQFWSIWSLCLFRHAILRLILKMLPRASHIVVNAPYHKT